MLEEAHTGIAKYAILLFAGCRELDPGIQVVGICTREASSPIPDGIRLERREAATTPRAWARFLQETIASWKPDVVHFPANGNLPGRLRVPLTVSTIHDVLPLEMPGFLGRNPLRRSAYIRSVRRDIRRSDLVFTDSQYSLRSILSLIRPGKQPVVLYPGPTLSSQGISKPVDRVPGGSFFLYVGGYDSRKKLENLVDAHLSLYREGSLRSRLVLTGRVKRFSNRFRVLVEEGIRCGAVVELGYVDDGDLIGLYKAALALIYPSEYEGFGLPPLEAMSLGCPVVTTRRTSLPEVCADAALYVEPNDLSDFRRILTDLERDAGLRGSLREKGLRQAEKFSWTGTCRTYLRILEGRLHGAA